MSTESRTMVVGGLRVALVRKKIKNLHLGVYPPDGRVRVAAPPTVSDAAIRVAIITRMRWIKKQRAAFEGQARESQREMVGGESHFFLGRRYRLDVVVGDGPTGVRFPNKSVMQLHARPDQGAEAREQILRRWYREQLRELVPPLVAKWEAKLHVRLRAWNVKRMKTKWGSCNAEARRIWLNLELAKKPIECLEYLVVHELVHLRVSAHDARFHALMDKSMPGWRQTRKQLNAAPLAHTEWEY